MAMRKTTYLALVAVVVIGLSLVACGRSTTTTTATTAPAVSKTTAPGASTAPATTSTTAPQAPKVIAWATTDLGTHSYFIASVAGESMKDKFGVTVRIVPLGSGVGKMTLLRTGSIHATFLGGESYLAREGVADFTSRAWGPQKLRMLYQFMGSTPTGYAVRGNSGITSLKDLKGKKAPFVLGMPSHNLSIEGALAFAGLTWNDVTKVELPSFGATIDAIIDGKTDVAVIGTSSDFATRIAASSGGMRLLPLPAADKEGWKRFAQFKPEQTPAIITQGPGLSATNTYEGASPPLNLDAFDTLSEDIAYLTTKYWVEAYPLYKDKDPRMMNASLNNVLDVVGKLPDAFHPGAIRYFKEIGRWTPQHEAWNNKALEREDKLMKAWDAFLAEADATKVTEDKLAALWEKYRTQVPRVE